MSGERGRPLPERGLRADEGRPVGFEGRFAHRESGAVRLGGVRRRSGLGRADVALGLEAGVVVGGEGELESAQLLREARVRARLAGLPFERPDLLFDLLDDVVEPREVRLRRREALDGLLAAALVLGDAGRLLEEAPSVGGVLREDVLDHRELDDRVRARAHARVHEQVEHVAEAADGPVEQVVRVAVAVEAPRDRDLGVLGREDAARVLDRERDLGHAERAAALGAVEDDAAHGV